MPELLGTRKKITNDQSQSTTQDSYDNSYYFFLTN